VYEAAPWWRTVSARLHMARMRRGGVEVARDETFVVLDAITGLATGIEAHQPTSAHVLIERCMVAANEAVARWLAERGVPGVYRVHDVPGPDAVRELSEVAERFGYASGFGTRLSPLSLAAFDHQIATSPSEPAIRGVLLRSLGPARYTVHPSTHFGLGAPLYLHFTSPIRRYADLAVHRLVKAYLHGARTWSMRDPALESLSRHINLRARLAARAETDRHRMLVAGYMTQHIGAAGFGIAQGNVSHQIDQFAQTGWVEILSGKHFRQNTFQRCIFLFNCIHCIVNVFANGRQFCSAL
jgi:ribonuclease R